MFYENNLKYKEMKYKLFDYSNFQAGINVDMDKNLIPLTQSDNSFNFSYKNGSLSTGLGIDNVSINYDPNDSSLVRGLDNPSNTEILAIWSQDSYFSEMETDARLLFAYGRDKKIYYHYLHANNTSFLPLENCGEVSEMPQIITTFINGQKAYLIAIPNVGLKVYYASNRQVENVEGAPSIESYCLHDGRLFVTDSKKKNRVWFSDQEDPTNWQLGDEQAGYVEFNDYRGNCLKTISFEGDVFVFREFGISKISSFKNQSNIVLENIYASSSAILKNTICLCGNKVLFMTKNGLYSFNGNSVAKVDLNIDGWLNKVNSYSMAKYYNDFYYLTCKIDFDDDKIIGCESVSCNNNALVKINLNQNDVTILRGVDIRFLNVLNDVGVNILVAVVKDGDEYKLGMVTENGKIFGENTYKYWRYSLYDFGMPNKKKFVKNFYLNTDANIKIRFLHDFDTTEFDVNSSSENVSLSPRISGYKIGVEIICEEAFCNISSPKILVGYL